MTCLHFGCQEKSYLDGTDVGVLCNILVLVQTILRGLSFTQIHGQFDKKHHHRFQGRDRTAASPLGGDMFVKDRESGGSLAHGDKFLGPL